MTPAITENLLKQKTIIYQGSALAYKAAWAEGGKLKKSTKVLVAFYGGGLPIWKLWKAAATWFQTVGLSLFTFSLFHQAKHPCFFLSFTL